jgi:hypothetical protein
MTLFLAISDNGNGTGGVATVTGTGGASVTVYSAAFAGVMGSLPLVAQGIGTGDGSLAVNPGTGYYLWLAQTATLTSNLVYQNLSDLVQAVNYRCMTGTLAQLQALALSGIAGGDIQTMWMRDYASWRSNYPGIAISPMGREEQPGILTGMDDITYPVEVAILDNGIDQPSLDIATRELWRQKIFRTFRHQRLPGVPEIITTDVTPDWVVRPEQGQRIGPFTSGLLLRFRSREVRGFGK